MRWHLLRINQNQLVQLKTGSPRPAAILLLRESRRELKEAMSITAFQALEVPPAADFLQIHLRVHLSHPAVPSSTRFCLRNPKT
jgi:hypothetical protein